MPQFSGSKMVFFSPVQSLNVPHNVQTTLRLNANSCTLIFSQTDSTPAFHDLHCFDRRRTQLYKYRQTRNNSKDGNTTLIATLTTSEIAAAITAIYNFSKKAIAAALTATPATPALAATVATTITSAPTA